LKEFVMSDERIDPMKELNRLRNTVGKVLEQGISTVQTTVQSAVQNAAPANPMRLDIYELDDEIVIKSNPLDGLIGESLEVSMEGNVLTIRCETALEETPELASYILQERKFGLLERNVTIPIPVKAEEASAKRSKS